MFCNKTMFSHDKDVTSFPQSTHMKIHSGEKSNVIMPLLRQAMWGNISICTVEKNQTNATNAIMQLFILAIWGHIWRCTVEKSQNNATNVIWHLIVLAIWPKNNLTKLGRYLHNLHKDSFLLNDPWQNPWMLRFIISMGFAMELWENPLHGKTHIPWLLPWYMGYAIDLWQNPLDTLIQPGHAVTSIFDGIFCMQSLYVKQRYE